MVPRSSKFILKYKVFGPCLSKMLRFTLVKKKQCPPSPPGAGRPRTCLFVYSPHHSHGIAWGRRRQEVMWQDRRTGGEAEKSASPAFPPICRNIAHHRCSTAAHCVQNICTRSTAAWIRLNYCRSVCLLTMIAMAARSLVL